MKIAARTQNPFSQDEPNSNVAWRKLPLKSSLEIWVKIWAICPSPFWSKTRPVSSLLSVCCVSRWRMRSSSSVLAVCQFICLKAPRATCVERSKTTWSLPGGSWPVQTRSCCVDVPRYQPTGSRSPTKWWSDFLTAPNDSQTRRG